MQVSDIEKNPEHASSTTSVQNNQLIGMSLLTPSHALQDDLEHEFAADV